MNPPDSTDKITDQQRVTGEILGQPTDVLIEQFRDQDTLRMVVTAVLPQFAIRNGTLWVIPPPRHPWDGTPG